MILKRNARKIITLSYGRALVPSELNLTIIIDKDSETWWSDLIQEINAVIPDFCQCLDARKLSDSLTNIGLCLANVMYDIYGIFVSAHGKFMKVNLQDFWKHQQLHQTYSVSDVCRECDSLKDPDMSVSIVMKNGFLSRVDKITKNDIVNLCVAVMSVPFPIVTPTSYASLTTSLDGLYNPDQQTFVSEIFMDIRYNLFLQSTSKQKGPCFPDFETSDHRRGSFPESYVKEEGVVEKLIDAGFYYPGFEDTVVCHYCGLCFQISTIKENNLDPWGVHSDIRPTCTYISSKERDDLDTDTSNGILVNSQYTKLVVQAFDMFSTRKKTFDRIDIEQNEFGVSNNNEKENLAENLAKAGFYYFGYNSVIGCFSCGLSLEYKSSEENPIDPWYIHAILCSKCDFLLKEKGNEFVRSVQKARRQPGMTDVTIVTFSWRKFGSDKNNNNSSKLIYRPCSYNDKHKKIKFTGRIQKLNS